VIVKIYKSGLFCFFLLLTLTNKAKSDSPYFPELGRNAIIQEAQDLKNSSVILVIALAPGLEDLPMVAYYRIGRGSRVAVAYVTNGEDLPGTGNDDSFYQLAGIRKEEAYQATSFVGAESYFLNIPASAVPAGGSTLHAQPDVEGLLRAKLDTVLELVKPDVVVLQRDPLLLMGDSPRLTFLKRIITKIRNRQGASSHWIMKRIFVQSKTGRHAWHVPVEQKNLLWSKSYSVIGKEARENYRSLTSLLPLLEKSEFHDYQLFFPSDSKQLGEMDGGLPALGQELHSAYPIVQKAVSFGSDFDNEKILGNLTIAIGQIDALINHNESSLNRGDLRVLSEWKQGLEKLRCSVLGIAIHYTVSDSVVTLVQLFYLHVKLDTSLFSRGEVRILFPDVIEKGWMANEKQDTFYPLRSTNEFRIFTPRGISYTSPETVEGFGAFQVRTPFTFMIVHNDSDPVHNFVYRKEIPLTIAPPRSVEVLTPHIIAHRDTILRVRFSNNTHDPMSGTVFLDDPFVSSPRHPVKLPTKNYVLIDTISLQWKDTTFSGVHEASLQAGQSVRFGKFYYQSIEVKTTSHGKVGFYSIADHPILQTAFLRLGVFPDKCDTTGNLDDKLSLLSTLVIDEFSLRSFVGSQQSNSALQRWLEAGGQMIVFPQYEFSDRSVDFGFLPIINAAGTIAIDTSDMVFQFPNRIRENDFRGMSVPLSFGELKFSDSEGVRIPLRSKKENGPLLAVAPVAKGKIIYVALNMDAQFLGMQDWAYKLLSNLLSYDVKIN
jgi:hypothetical protein